MSVKTRIQVSIHPDLVGIAERRMAERKFSSFSGYLETLIREEHERRQASTLQEPGTGEPLRAMPAAEPVHYQTKTKRKK